MYKLFFKKYFVVILVFSLYQAFLFVNKLNESNLLPYINFILYFVAFLLIHENLKYSKLNKGIIYLFYFLYGYISVIMSLSVLLREVPNYSYFFYISFEIILRIFIIVISVYLLFYCTKIIVNSKIKTIASFFFAFILIIINYFNFILNPHMIAEGLWGEWILRNYISIVISILFLLVFWYRYYQKVVVVSEYLISIIFLFTLSNMIEALHFIAFQWNREIWFKGQYFNIIVNVLMVVIWYFRLIYLKSEISIENERYLMNFQVLNGFISKPKKSILFKWIVEISEHHVIFIFIGIIFIIVTLFLIQKITFYLLLNTIFILFVVMLALYFSLSSMRRDWQNQIGFLIDNQDDQ